LNLKEPTETGPPGVALIVASLVWASFGVVAAVGVLGSRPDIPDRGDLIGLFSVIFGAPLFFSTLISRRAGGIAFIVTGSLLLLVGVLTFAYQPLMLAMAAVGVGAWAVRRNPSN
jgi:hypothetical protein